MTAMARSIVLNQKFVLMPGGKMKNFDRKGYATILTIITIGLLGIVIFGLLNLYSLNHKKIQSNESSIKAYYLGESGIAILKNEIDVTFERYFDEYVNDLIIDEKSETSESVEENIQSENQQSFKDFVMIQNGFKDLQRLRIEEDLFEFYENPHGWRLEIDFEDENITLYATSHYKKARKRLVAIISYPDVLPLSEFAEIDGYRFIASEILIYYQGYEGE